MGQLNRSLLERCPLGTDVVPLGINASTFIDLVGQIELVALVYHQAVERIALTLESSPLVFFVLAIQCKGWLLLNSAEEVDIQTQGNTVHQVENIQTDVSIVMVPGAQDQGVVVGEVAAAVVVGQRQWLTHHRWQVLAVLDEVDQIGRQTDP